MGFKLLPCAKGQRAADDWLGGDTRAGAHEKIVDLFGGCFGSFGTQMGSNKSPRVPNLKGHSVATLIVCKTYKKIVEESES